MALEVEIKLALDTRGMTPDAIRDSLVSMEFEVTCERTFEDNVVFDSTKGSLAKQNKLLRLRAAGARTYLTYKSMPEKNGSRAVDYKVREEKEIRVSDFDTALEILTGLGLAGVYRYQKYRTTLKKGDLTACIDETPIGCFMELEGNPGDIDDCASALGFTRDDYITVSYMDLHKRWAADRGLDWPRHMVFE